MKWVEHSHLGIFVSFIGIVGISIYHIERYIAPHTHYNQPTQITQCRFIPFLHPTCWTFGITTSASCYYHYNYNDCESAPLPP